MEHNQKLKNQLYNTMLSIRMVEEKLLELFSKGELVGTTHTSIGQEANAAASLIHLHEGDVVFSNHRCHGHYIAYGGPLESFFAEVMGKESGLNGGRGGSQHICYKTFHTNGIQGGIVSNATGAALAEKMSKTGQINVVFLGDGTLGEGLVYESLNFASLWSIPILYILENNQYSQSTPIHLGVSGKIEDRPKSFGIETHRIKTNDALILNDIFKKRFDFVRSEQRPFFQIVDTYRLAAHSKGDDDRDPKEIESWRKNDPIKLIETHITDPDKQDIRNKINIHIEDAIEKAHSSPYPTVAGVEFDTSARVSPPIIEANPYKETKKRMKVVQALNLGINKMMSEDKKVILMGEDVIDPYGGAFKISKGLSTSFPNQVLTTPLSEAGMVGLATGMALRGMRPVVEIMFGDFLSLAADQLLNHSSKYQWMYKNKVQVPLVVRTPMGGKRGYGPTHSQSIEKMFIGIPGLTVVSPSNLFNPGELLYRAVMKHDSALLFIENKALYSAPVLQLEKGQIDEFAVKTTNTLFPSMHLSLANFDKPDMMLITYGGNVPMAMDVARTLLIDEEIIVDVIVVSLLAPLPMDEILEYLGNCPIVVTLEEGTQRACWGTEVIAEIVLREQFNQSRKFLKLAAPDCPIPSCKQLEENLLPNIENTTEKVLEFYDAGMD